jgi:flagellar hook-length control protein FliK
MQLSVRSSEWGELRIELVVDGSEVRATVRTECDAARDALASQLDDLRARLEDRGLRLGEFRVNVGRPSDPAEEGGVAPRSIRRQVLDLVV